MKNTKKFKFWKLALIDPFWMSFYPKRTIEKIIDKPQQALIEIISYTDR